MWREKRKKEEKREGRKEIRGERKGEKRVRMKGGGVYVWFRGEIMDHSSQISCWQFYKNNSTKRILLLLLLLKKNLGC